MDVSLVEVEVSSLAEYKRAEPPWQNGKQTEQHQSHLHRHVNIIITISTKAKATTYQKKQYSDMSFSPPLRPFPLKVMIVSENWSPSHSFHNTFTEIDSLPTLPHPSTIRSLSYLESLIRNGVLGRLSTHTEGEVQRREMARVRTMRVLGMSAHMGRENWRMVRDEEGMWVGEVRSEVLGEGNWRGLVGEIYRRRDSRDYIEVRVDPEARDVSVGRPIAGPSGRSSRDRSGRRPPSPMFGNSREARQSRIDARMERLERDQKELNMAEERGLMERTERLRQRFERLTGRESMAEEG